MAWIKKVAATLYTVHSTLYNVLCTHYVHCKFDFETYYNAQASKLYTFQYLLINLNLLSKQYHQCQWRIFQMIVP